MVFMQQIVKNAPRFYYFWHENFLKHFYVYNLKKKHNNITASIQKHTTNIQKMFKNKLYSLPENHKPLHCSSFKSIDIQ